MRKISLCLALALTLISCTESADRAVVSAKTPAGRLFHFMPVDEEGIDKITITIAWPMHWAYEAKNNPAVPYVAADTILNGGTKALAPQEVLEFFNDKDARGRFYVRANHAFGELTFPEEYLEEIVSIASEMLSTPQFDEAWIERIKKGLSANTTQAQTKIARRMEAVARLAILGEGALDDFLSLSDLDAIDKVEVDDLRRWHAETIVGSGLTIAVTGAISREDAAKAIDRLLFALPEGRDRSAPAVEADFSPKTILLHLPDAEKSILGFFGRLPPSAEGGYLTDLLALRFFARPVDGPLFDAVRTVLRASYGFDAGYMNYGRAIRIMFISGEVESAKLGEATASILNRYEDFRTKPDLTDFAAMRRDFVGGSTRNVQYVDIAARRILQLALDGHETGDAPRLGELLNDIRLDIVIERLSRVFPSRDELIVVAVSPNADALPGACVITRIEMAARCS